MAKNEPTDVETVDDGDAPLIDLNDASIKKMMARAEKRGTITIDEINAAIPADQNETFESWVVSRFGRRLFEMFFKSYSEIPPNCSYTMASGPREADFISKPWFGIASRTAFVFVS